MEPRLPAPNPSPEMGGYKHQELPVGPELHPEAAPDKKPEKTGESQEAAPAGPSNAGPALPVPQIPAVPAQDSTPAQSPSAQATRNDTPLTAADEDLVEKEWVDKAKKIVAETKDDPYRQEKEVSKLQADYLLKRYGKEVKLTND